MRHLIHVLPIAILAGSLGQGAARAELPDFLRQVSAGKIAAISDGDFVGQTYATGQLAPREAKHDDLLTVIKINDGRSTSAAIPVSNSVTAAPEVLALTPDGKTAFVTERLKERGELGETVKDLAPGNQLFAISLADGKAPRLAATASIVPWPEALAVSQDGKRVAIVSNTPEASFLQIASYQNGRFGEVARFDLADLGINGGDSGPRGGVTATNVHWHPSGRLIAVNINTQNRVAFFEVGERPRLWGNVVEVGKDPFVGRFTPDGRHYLTSNWGRDFAATNFDGRLPRTPSSISVVRLSELDETGNAAEHSLVSSAATDLSAEGIAVSPDGLLVATINMRGTAFPPESPRFQRDATVTLLTLDPGKGALEKVADYPFEGVLPEGGAFDLSGDHLLVTVFHGHESKATDKGAGLEVFRVIRGERPSLERVGRIPLPHGAHHVAVAR